MTDRTKVQHRSPVHFASSLAFSTLLMGLVLAPVSSAQDRVVDSLSKTRVRPDPVLLRVPVPTSDGGRPSEFKFRSYGPILITVGGWQGAVARDPRTDQKKVVFTLPAANVPTTSLMLRCEKGNLDAYIHFQKLARRQVTVRFGTDPPGTQEWFSAVNDTTVSVAGDQNKVEEFIRKLADYTRLSIQVNDRASPNVFIFDLGGISVVETQLEGACLQ